MIHNPTSALRRLEANNPDASRDQLRLPRPRDARISGPEAELTYSFRFLIGALAAVLAIGLPLFANQIVNETTSRSVYQIVNGDAQQVVVVVNQMRWMPFIPQENLNSVITAYQASKDPERRELLSKAYRELAGEDIDTRIMILND